MVGGRSWAEEAREGLGGAGEEEERAESAGGSAEAGLTEGDELGCS